MVPSEDKQALQEPPLDQVSRSFGPLLTPGAFVIHLANNADDMLVAAGLTNACAAHMPW